MSTNCATCNVSISRGELCGKCNIIEYDCYNCHVEVEQPFADTCDACNQLDILRCSGCIRDPLTLKSTLKACGGCEYPVCSKHSKKFIFWEDGVEQSTVLCVFANGKITQCRDKFIVKNYDKNAKLRFHIDWLFDYEYYDARTEASYLLERLPAKKRSRNTEGRRKSAIEEDRTREWTCANTNDFK